MSTGNGKGTLPPKGKIKKIQVARRSTACGPLLPGAPPPLDPWPFWKFPALTRRPHVQRGPPPSPCLPPKISRRSFSLLPLAICIRGRLRQFLSAASSSHPSGVDGAPFLRRRISPRPIFPFLPLFLLSSSGTSRREFFSPSPGRSRSRRRQISSGSASASCSRCRLLLSWALRAHQAAKGNRRFELWARLMASMAQVEERDGLDSSGLPIDKRRPLDAAKSSLMDDAVQPKEGMDGYPVKVRKPYTITKQREKWTEEEHEKFLEALKLYGRSWRQIQEHIGTKTAVQIRSHAQKFFSKVVREPGASNAIEIPPPRPKRKPLHPYPRKCADSSTVANPAMGQPKLAPISSSSGSDQENGSPVSVLSAMQSDAFGSSVSNPSTGCTSPASSDDGNNVPALVNEDTLLTQQIEDDQSGQEIKLDNSDGDLSEEDSSSGVQETSLKLFGKTVIIPDPKKVCSSDVGRGDGEKRSQSSKQEASQASSIGGIAAYPAHNGCLLPYHSLQFHMGESGDARISPLHVWWPYYGFPVGHPRGLGMGLHTEGTCESDTGKSPSGESSSDCMSDVQTTTAPTNCKVVKDSLGAIQVPEPALSFELKPSVNSAFVRVKPGSNRSQSARGFVPYKRCKVE